MNFLKNLSNMAAILFLSTLFVLPVHATERGNVGFGFGTSFHKHQQSALKNASAPFFRLYGDPNDALAVKTVKKGKTTLEIGALPKVTKDGVEVDVMTYATGKGNNYRKWKITDVKMNVGGELLRRTKGDTCFVDVGEAATKPIAVIGTVLNTAVPGDSYDEGSSQGGACAPGKPCGPSGTAWASTSRV